MSSNTINRHPHSPKGQSGREPDIAEYESGESLDLNQIPVRKSPPRHKKGQKFLKGPIPLSWLLKAATLPGKAFIVGVAIWYLAGFKRNGPVKVTGKVLRQFGVSRWTSYRNLDALSQAGLIEVCSNPGRCPIVTLLDADTTITNNGDK